MRSSIERFLFVHVESQFKGRTGSRLSTPLVDALLDCDLFDFDTAIWLQAFNQGRALLLAANDNRISLALANRTQAVGSDALPTR